MYAASLLFLGFFVAAPVHADPCVPGQCVLDDVQSALDTGRAAGSARHPGFGSPLQNAAGRVVFPWDGPGDTMPFELTVPCQGDPSQLLAEVWTNANHNEAPETWEAVPMRLAEAANGLCTFTAALPIEEVGNFRATARISTDGGKSFRWVNQGGHDLRFRPHAEEHDGLNLVEINISSVNGGHGTLDDLAGKGSPAENGRYTLEYLAGKGVNAVWVQPPFARSVWEHRHPLDDAGSPYAAKDFFAVDPDLSARAQEVLRRGGSQDEARAAATEEWQDFVARAHALGIKVIVDVALNHVGHNYEFADLFVGRDAQGNETREVRRNDFSQIVPDPAQRALVQSRLTDRSTPPYMEYLAPWLYSSRGGDSRGAQDVSDILSGGAQWHDTKQLNHGGSYGVANPEVNRAVTDWLGRVLEYWAVDMGADGFRLDHLTGLPERVLDQGLNHAQAAVDAHRPGTHLYLTGEDFFNAEYNASFLDNIQDTWMRNALLGGVDPGSLRGLLENPYFDDRELLNLSSHDEERFEWHDDMAAAGRLQSLLPLLGGASMLVAGDELGERYAMPFKQHRPVGAIATPSPAGLHVADLVGRAGAAKQALPALADDNRAFLDPTVGGRDPDLLALARFPDRGKEGNPVVVFANMSERDTRENAFALDAATSARLDPKQRYQAYDHMADDPSAPLWSEPLTGREIQERGVYAKLAPYQVQAVEIAPVE